MTAHIIYLHRPVPAQEPEQKPVKGHVNPYLRRELRTEEEARADRKETMQ